MILNLHCHYIEDFFLWLLHTMQLSCQEDSSLQWFCFIYLSVLFLKHYFLCDDVLVFSVYHLHSVQSWICQFILRVSELHSHKAVLQACCCQREINLIFCQNCLFTKDFKSIAELYQTKNLVFCQRACWW